MCSRFPSLFFVCLMFAGSCLAKPLTFCADPANLPFSSRQQTGFENRIAHVIGNELHVPVQFYWARMGRGFVRNVLNKGECDALMGVPVGMRGLLVTTPYYRSAYVFVTCRSARPISSLDDPRLRSMQIGVQVLDDDYAPPARALARRNLTKNVVGFEMEEPGEIVRAVARGRVDTAIVWGPLAGYFAQKYANKLRLTPVTPEIDQPMLPFAYAIAVGVRQSEPDLYHRIDEALKQAAPRIQSILRQYNVPQLSLENQTVQVGASR